MGAERAIMIVLFWLPMFLRDGTLVSPKELGNSSTEMLTVGRNVEVKVVSVKASVDPKATAAERAIVIVLFWLPMFLRDTTLVSPKDILLNLGKLTALITCPQRLHFAL